MSQTGKWKEEQILVLCPGSRTTMAQLGCGELTPPTYRIPTRMFRDEETGDWRPYRTWKRKKIAAAGAAAANAANAANGADGAAKDEDEWEYVEDPDSDEGAVYPLEGGYITNMDAFLAFLEHVHGLLTTTYHNTPIMLMASPQWTRPDCEAVALYIFEKTRTPALCMINSAVATQYGLKWPHMTVIDIGFEKVDVTCIYDSQIVNHMALGYPAESGEDRLISGGEVFTRRLLTLLQQKQFSYDMAEQLKKSPACEVLPYAPELPQLMDVPKDDGPPAVLAAAAAPAAAVAATATAAKDAPSATDAAQVVEPGATATAVAAVASAAGDMAVDDGIPPVADDDGVLDVAAIVTSGQTKEFLAKKEKEKERAGRFGRRAKDKEAEAAAAKPVRLPNSKRARTVFHFEELVEEENEPQQANHAAQNNNTTTTNSSSSNGSAAHGSSGAAAAATGGSTTTNGKSHDEDGNGSEEGSEADGSEMEEDEDEDGDADGDAEHEAGSGTAAGAEEKKAEPAEKPASAAKPKEEEAAEAAAPKSEETKTEAASGAPKTEPDTAEEKPAAGGEKTEEKPAEAAAAPPAEAPAAGSEDATMEDAPADEKAAEEGAAKEAPVEAEKPAAAPTGTTAAAASTDVVVVTGSGEQQQQQQQGRRFKRVRRDFEIGVERFTFADRGEIDRIVETIYRTVQGVEDMYMRPSCWENLVFVGNGSRLRGLRENILQTLHARHLISPSTATMFTSELPSHLGTPSGTGAQTPTGSFSTPPHQLPTTSSVNPLLQAATTASMGGPGFGPGGPGSQAGGDGGSNSGSHSHHFHSQTPTSIRLAALPTYLGEWTKNGFEEAMFLGAQVAARIAFCVHNLDVQGTESQRLMSLSRIDYNELGPKGIRTHSMLG